MTDIKAEVVEFDLIPHPNADTLSIASLKNKGWQCVVRTEEFQGKSKGIYIPLDAQVPTTGQFAFLDRKGTQQPFRIRTIKLRGALSQGLLVAAPEEAELGQDFAEELGVTRYEPPVPVHMQGMMAPEHPNFLKYTKIANYKNEMGRIQPTDQVEVTEKIHGTNARYGWVLEDDEFHFMVGSHNSVRKMESTDIYVETAKQLDFPTKLAKLAELFKPQINLIVYGEIYGPKIQDLKYGVDKPTFRLFDVYIDGRWLNYEDLQAVAVILEVETVPILYRGPFDLTKIRPLVDGVSTLESAHCREGVVVKCLGPETYLGHRKIIKMISDDYLLRKNATDGH